MIKSISLNRMTYHELLGFFQKIIGYIETFPEEIEEIAQEIKDFEESVAYFDEVLKSPIRTGLTPRIQVVNELCLQQWKGIRGEVVTKKHSTDQELVELSDKAQILLDTYRDLRTMNTSERTSRIDNLLQDIKQTFSSAELTKLNLTLWVSELQKANNQYKSLVELRTQLSKTIPPGSSLLAKNEAKKKYKYLVESLNVFSRKNTPGRNAITYLINKINLLVDYEKPRLKARITRAKNRQEKGEMPEDPIPEMPETPDELPETGE